MREIEHHIQDACERYAVYKLQSLAEQWGLAGGISSPIKSAAFQTYLEARGLTEAALRVGAYSAYLTSVDRHMPTFLRRLGETFPEQTFEFTDVEAEYRNLGRKGDFLLQLSSGSVFSVSLKNYREDASNPQVCSGTFNSFVLNFLFEPSGVGGFLDPATNLVWRGSSFVQRDAQLLARGHGNVVPLIHRLDEINAEIKAQFVYGADFEVLDEVRFDEARKRYGAMGAAITLEILDHIDPALIRTRMLKMIGLDGQEEILFIDPHRYTDSITSEGFRNLRFSVIDPETQLLHRQHGQGIHFSFVLRGNPLLNIHVPFTINKNGAWVSERYEGMQWHVKEGRELAYGQRRPKKSKELATSINTYVKFGDAGIFV